MRTPNNSETQTRGPINDSTGSTIRGFIGLGLALLILAAYMLKHLKSEGSSLFSVIFCHVIFLGVPLLLLLGAYFLSWCRRRFGTAQLFLDAATLVIGGEVNGTVKISKPLKDFEHLELKIIYVRIHARLHSCSESILWQSKSLMKRKQISFTEGLTVIPINLCIPETVRTGKNHWLLGHELQWKLQVEAFPNNKPHFFAEFKLPVVDASPRL